MIFFYLRFPIIDWNIFFSRFRRSESSRRISTEIETTFEQLTDTHLCSTIMLFLFAPCPGSSSGHCYLLLTVNLISSALSFRRVRRQQKEIGPLHIWCMKLNGINACSALAYTNTGYSLHKTWKLKIFSSLCCQGTNCHTTMTDSVSSRCYLLASQCKVRVFK